MKRMAQGRGESYRSSDFANQYLHKLVDLIGSRQTAWLPYRILENVRLADY
jgi:hypothetical protein